MQTNAKYALISGICLSTVLCTLKAPLKYNCKAKGDPLWNRKKFFFQLQGYLHWRCALTVLSLFSLALFSHVKESGRLRASFPVTASYVAEAGT